MKKLYLSATAALDGLLRHSTLIAHEGCGLPERQLDVVRESVSANPYPVDI